MMHTKISKAVTFVLLLLFIGVTLIASMAEGTDSHSSPAAVYIVYTESPAVGVEPESHHLRTLTPIVGSEEAAKDALIYVYKNAATGFSAKLTPEQVSQLEKQPGVLQVVPNRTVQLHGGAGRMNRDG